MSACSHNVRTIAALPLLERCRPTSSLLLALSHDGEHGA